VDLEMIIILLIWLAKLEILLEKQSMSLLNI
jgi:hypothetical protein